MPSYGWHFNNLGRVRERRIEFVDEDERDTTKNSTVYVVQISIYTYLDATCYTVSKNYALEFVRIIC